MNFVRLLIVSLVVLGAVTLGHHVTTGAGDGGTWAPEQDAAQSEIQGFNTPITFTSSQQCKACHEEVFAEWEDSHHRIAYTNPEVQLLSRGFQDRDCLPCHLPRPVFETGVGVRVLERATRHEEGVDCFTCHFNPHKNAMIGAGPLSAAASDAPCQPVAHPSVTEMTMCAPCHNQHKVHDDWAQTRFAVADSPQYQDCNDCHMPVVQRADGSMGRDHRFLGAHDTEFLKTAATVTASAGEGSQLLVEVRNDGTGHHFPADERHRAADLHLVVEDASGVRVDVRLDRYRNPYRQEFELKNPLREPGATRDYELEIPGIGTAKVHAVRVPAEHNPIRNHPYPENMQIPAGEARSYVVELPGGVRAVTVRLWFRIQPLLPDEKASLLHEQTITW